MTVSCHSKIKTGGIMIGSKKIFYSILFYSILFSTVYGKEFNSKVSSDSVIVILKSGEDAYLRTYYDENRDLVQQLRLFNTSVIGDNKPFNFYRTYLISNTNSNSTIPDLLQNSTIIHNCSDDSCPMNFNGTYIGANHGCSDMKVVTSTNHDKTAEDVGSEWIDRDNRKWYLLNVFDSEKLWFLSENIGYGDEWNFDTTINGNLIHSNNALHTDSITVESYTYGQLEPAFKNHIKKMFINDSTEVIVDGIYYSNIVRIEEHYELVDPSSALEFVISQVGSSVQPELNNGDANATLDITYFFDEFGGCKIDYFVYLDKLIDVGIISGIQSGPINKGNYSNFYAYIPNSLPINDGIEDWDFRNLRDFSYSPNSTLYFTNPYWEDPNNPPYRFVQFLGSNTVDLDVSFTQSFRIYKGNAQPSLRSNTTSRAVFIPGTRKTYPYVFDSSSGDLPAGESYEIYAYRGYISPRRFSRNASTVFFYEDDEKVYLTADYHKACNDTISLPIEYSNRVVEIIDKNENIEVLNSYINGNKLYVNTINDYSYLNLVLSEFLPPENLVISASPNQVNLTWERANGADSYKIFRSSSPYTDFIEVGTSDSLSFTDFSITGYDKYFYRVSTVVNEK